MSDFLVTDARTLDGRPVDIAIRDGVVSSLDPAGSADTGEFAEADRYHADGRLVTRSLTEPHTHLDAALSAGEPRWNDPGTLAEGWRIWEDLRESVTKAEIKERATETIYWLVSNGVTRVRTHVDTTYEDLTGVEALLELQDELSEIVEIQTVAFPMSGLFADAQNEDLLTEALEMGVDVVGGIPHNERTRGDGVKEVHTVMDLADRYDRPLDLHIDESDDPSSRFTEVLASEAIYRNCGHRTTASHVTAMHSYPNSYASKLVGLIAQSGMSVVTNPPVNAVLQGRHDDYPRRRGHTRIDELQEAGVPVGVGQDDIVDGWFHYGDGDPLTALYILLHYAHMHGRKDVETLWRMMTESNAAVWGDDDPGLSEGVPGSLVVYDSATPFEALRVRPVRPLVLKDGDVVASADPAQTRVHHGGEQAVDLRRGGER